MNAIFPPLIFCSLQLIRPAGACLRQGGGYHTPEQARSEMNFRWPEYDRRERWEERAKEIRQGILEGTEFFPLPGKKPLLPSRHSVQKVDGYTGENVALAIAPGFFLWGNLHLSEQQGKVPLGLSTHGHSPGMNPLEYIHAVAPWSRGAVV